MAKWRGWSDWQRQEVLALALSVVALAVGRAAYAQTTAPATVAQPATPEAEAGTPPAGGAVQPEATPPAPGAAEAPAPAPAPAAALQPQGQVAPQQAQPAPATGQPSAGCLMPCPEGYSCIQGQCVALCAPPCGPGYVCTEKRECVSTEEVERQKQEEAEDAAELARRQSLRLLPRAFIYVGGGTLIWPQISGDGDPYDLNTLYLGPNLQFGAGYQQHLTRRFGLAGRLVVAAGPWVASISRDTEDEPYDCDGEPCREHAMTSHGEFVATVAEFVLVIGPFGRFFLGPSAFTGYVAFADSGKEDYVRGDEFEYPTSSSSSRSGDGPGMTLTRWKNTATAGAGLRFGFYLGKEEQIELSSAGRFGMLTSTTSHLYIEVLANVGFAL